MRFWGEGSPGGFMACWVISLQGKDPGSWESLREGERKSDFHSGPNCRTTSQDGARSWSRFGSVLLKWSPVLPETHLSCLRRAGNSAQQWSSTCCGSFPWWAGLARIPVGVVRVRLGTVGVWQGVVIVKFGRATILLVVYGSDRGRSPFYSGMVKSLTGRGDVYRSRLLALGRNAGSWVSVVTGWFCATPGLVVWTAHTHTHNTGKERVHRATLIRLARLLVPPLRTSAYSENTLLDQWAICHWQV